MTEKFTYSHIIEESAILELIEWHNQNSAFVVIDLETTGLDRFKDKILHGVISTRFSLDAGGAALVEPKLLKHLSKIEVPLIFHNFKFDLAFLNQAGVDLSNKEIYDTMLMHHLYDENAEHGLDAIIQQKYKDNYKEVFWSKHETYESARYSDKLEYACKDVIYTGRLYVELLSLLEIAQIPDELVQHVHKLAKYLYKTEIEGVKVDFDYLLKIGEELKNRIVELKQSMASLVSDQIAKIELDMWNVEIDKRKTPKGKSGVKKPEFNFDSQKQLKDLIYKELNLPVQCNKKTKQPSLDDTSLEELKALHPIIPMLQEYRGHQKVYGAYIEGTLERAINGRVYPSFNVNGTVTGRISSSNPNLQQLPRDGGVRGIYVPDAGHKFISCDFGMLEVVIAAHFSHDPNLLKIINEGASKHDITAEALKVDRQTAKTLNFAFQYGCTPHKVKDILGCSIKKAQEAWNLYWETYGGERAVIDECKKKVDDVLPIVNPFGRQRHFPATFEKPWYKESAYRQAYSSLIQGTGADITSRAFYIIAEQLEILGWGRAMFTIHDEILIMVKEDCCKQAAELLEYTMINVGKEIGLTVPLTVDCSEPLDRWSK